MLRSKEKMIEPVVMDDATPAPQVLWRPSLVLGAAAVLVCLPPLGGEFVWDDVLLIEHNPAMDDLAQVWRTAWGDFFQQGGAQLSTSGFFRPVPTLMNGLTVAVFGKSPLAFHLGNLLLHLGTCLLGLALLCRLGWSTIGATAAMLLFTVHPMQAESLAYISCRPELCAGLAAVLSLWCYDRYRRDAWTAGLPWAMVAYLVALLSKEVAIGTIGVVAWLELTQYDDRRWSAPLTMGAAILVYGILRLVCLDTQATGRFALSEQPFVALNLLGVYLQQLCLPQSPRALYEHLSLTGFQLTTVWGLVLVIATLVVLIRETSRQSALALGLLWLGVFIAPVLHLVPFGTIAAERYLYVPMLGFAALFGAGVSIALETSERWAPLVKGAVVCLLLCAALVTTMRTTVWNDELTLWGDEIGREQAHHSAFANLGTALAEAGRLDEAHAAYDRAWTLAPGHRLVFRNLMRLEARSLPPAMRRPFLKAVLRSAATPTELRQWKERLMDVGSGVTARRLEVRALHLEKGR